MGIILDDEIFTEQDKQYMKDYGLVFNENINTYSFIFFSILCTKIID